MNNTFSLNRFTLLFKKYSLENSKTVLLSIGVLAGLLAIILSYAAYQAEGRLPAILQSIIFVYFLAGAGSIYTSLTFAELGDKRKATGMLTLPASHFEKYLVSWLYSYIIYQLIFVGIFYVVDFAVISISTPPAGNPNTLVNIFDIDQMAAQGFLIYALLHAFAIWGAIFFEKMHFIKTFFVFFIYLILLIIINNPLIHLLTGNNNLRGLPFQWLFIASIGHYQRILPTGSMKNVSLFVLGLTIVILWASAFFRLKEKEI